MVIDADSKMQVKPILTLRSQLRRIFGLDRR